MKLKKLKVLEFYQSKNLHNIIWVPLVYQKRIVVIYLANSVIVTTHTHHTIRIVQARLNINIVMEVFN